jgi:hypothetical protein
MVEEMQIVHEGFDVKYAADYSAVASGKTKFAATE